MPFRHAPEVPFAALTLKVINRLGWPSFLENYPQSGLIKAHLVYEIGGDLSYSYRENLYFYRRFAAASSSPREAYLGLIEAGAFNATRVDLLVTDCEALKALGILDRRWVKTLSRSLEGSLKKGWFQPDAYIFRMFAEDILQKEWDSESPSYAKGFEEWCRSQGWHWGVKTFDYDVLTTRCVAEDAYVDRAYREFGFADFPAFLNTGPFSYRTRNVFHESLLKCIMSMVLRIIEVL